MLYCVFRKTSYTTMTPVIKAVFNDYQKAFEYIRYEFIKNRDIIDSSASTDYIFIGNEYCYEIHEVVTDFIIDELLKDKEQQINLSNKQTSKTRKHKNDKLLTKSKNVARNG